ncbi:MAG: Hpt domain-containing protein [Chroococcidiopsidaceae cyanobacterium CP_BM_ER_R8_30]|nr:Hpt domain-containing protein [Chroococcidiopsidaceae cyanobacterium CP_BM_ER_R8_30]
MLPEQDQRILGYFIEEAKDHLQTIEQGMLNLQHTLKEPEMVNEIFRAAHSIKGGAAMLGYDSIQQTAHHLEDYFKILQECPTIPVDQKLESLLLRVFDTLQALIAHLAHKELSAKGTERLMSEMTLVFKLLDQHLSLLAKSASSSREKVSSTTLAAALPMFENYVLQQLQQMLQLFKQTETLENRQQLQAYAQKLVRLGEKLNLPSWCALCQTVANAISNRENAYRTLAPTVIKELKQSQELVMASREAEIKASPQLQSLSGTYLPIRSPQKS